MTRDEAIDVLESIAALYPNFEMTERKGNLLIPVLMKMDYQGLLKQLSDYAASNPFPPTIAAIADYPPEDNVYLTRMKRWKEEAGNVPLEVKQRFRVQMKTLIKEKAKS
ncbi:replicative helicase loader/inhibitor [Gracilibacillus kekensis]|uniref:Loader and inhibitor of phage G40P n=1 Tax=Gracilibacillus kekensis TaxID=1027249 RepID=A0A1M7LDB6_9BACI|nr:replicative helicase loader/inhibitor [Gracilibacillus kekensis]SHM75893.1 Loader and inhibitor of phage G40P [Gracilibacillus kekensis]